VFFLVSGYIVPASLERRGSVRGFWVSRVFRLYPLYLFALSAMIVLWASGIGSLAYEMVFYLMITALFLGGVHRWSRSPTA
jgi:peptidoglycan/LPS O-acetylase OafA/YrhL